ncbi:hypothetical protein [Roseinatronobacter sp.]|uniref:hypothetical protein n=1 Tax=Roseinatronobacter sp. TaxID=1945755 RepID=UPI0025E9DE40|nr:hypothetical protein [Rhodobaca sp.]
MNEHNPDLTLNLRADMSPAARKAYIQKWIAKNQRRMAAGLGATLMTLPLLAQAQSAEGMVNALDIAGVRSVALNSDGTVQLTLSNGQQVQVAASSVQVAADGTLLISAAAAELVADVAAGIAAAGATGGGIGSGGIAAAVGGLGLAAAAAAGGGGGSGSSSSGGGGSAALPVLNDASFSSPQSLQQVFGAASGELLATDVVTVTVGPEGEEQTLSASFDEAANDGEGGWVLDALTPEQRAALPQGTQVLNFSATRTNEDGEEEVITGMITVSIDTIAPEIEITTPIAGDGILNAAEAADGFVIEGTAEGVENGQMVTLDLNGTEFTTSVSGEAWSLAITQADIAALGLDSGDEIVITANVSDRAGNPAAEAEVTVQTDFIADISIEDVVIETVNTFIGVTIRGETVGVEEGQPVTLMFNGASIAGVTVQANGSWSAFIEASVINALGDGAEVSISASVADIALNSDSSSTTATTDFSTPPVAVTSPATGGFINAEAAGQPLVVEGVSLPDADVTVAIGGATRNIQADGEGRWDTSFNPDDLPTDEGDFVISATSLIDGVPVPAQDVTLTKDTVAPDAPVLGLAQDTGTVAGETSNGTVNITNLEEGASAEYSLDGGTTWTPVEGASFTLTGDGVKSVTVRQTDVAGNTSDNSSELEFTLDTAPPTVTVTSLAGITPDGTLTAAELFDGGGDALETVVLTGTATGAVDGAPVTVLINGTAIALDPAPTVTGEAWSANIPVTALAGLETVEVRTVDGAGNEGTGTAGFINDVVIPTITVTQPADAFVVGLDEYENGFTISGTTTDVPDGPANPTDGSAAGVVTITITANDGSIDPLVQFVSVVDGAWNFSVSADQIVGAPDQTEFTLNVSVVDGVFPIAVTDDIGISTNIPPEISFDPIGEDGALILADIAASGEFTFSGTTRGVQEGQQVTLFVGNGDDVKDTLFADPAQNPTVDENGNWSVTFAPDISGINPGTELVLSAEVSNASGTPAETSETVVAYLASVFTAVFEGAQDGISSFFVYTDLDNVASGGIQRFILKMEFDPDVVRLLPAALTEVGGDDGTEAELVASGGLHSTIALGERNPNEAPDGVTEIFGVRLLGQITSFASEALYVFDMENLDTSSVIEIKLTEASANDIGVGSTVSYTGTSNDDVIVAANVDTVIRGRGGDDEIDVSAAGVNTIIFEAGSRDNDFDTITGFTLGGALPDRIAFAFDRFGQDTLRGDSSEFQVTDGGAVGADVGLLVFSTAVANFDSATLDAALTGLTGLSNGDDLYLLIGNGEDAILTAIRVDGSGASVYTSSGRSYAEFKDIGDLSGFSSANIIGFEQYNA